MKSKRIKSNLQQQPLVCLYQNLQDPRYRLQSDVKKSRRPAHSSVYSIAPTTEPPEKDVAPETPILKVKPSTFEILPTLFFRSDFRGSIPWSDLEAAMG